MGALLLPHTTGAMRDLWRELTNEKDSTRVPDATVDLYLQAGLESFNRRVGYHYTDSTADVVLVAGTQEYALPADCISIQFVEWHGRDLKKSDVERWRDKNIDWRNEPAGEPVEWSHYGNKLILRPKPSAEAVSLAASPVIRYVSTPRDVATYGFEQINTQDQRIPVYYAVAEWCFRLPGAEPGVTERGQAHEKMFETETQKVAAEYAARRIAK